MPATSAWESFSARLIWGVMFYDTYSISLHSASPLLSFPPRHGRTAFDTYTLTAYSTTSPSLPSSSPP